MQRYNNIKSLLLLIMLLLVGVEESVAGVSYNQIKDGGVYTICNFVSNGNARNYISYDGTSITYGAAPSPSTAEYGYWIAHKLSGDKYCFESNQTPGVYLSGKDTSGKTVTVAVATGSVFTLSSGTASTDAYVSLYTATLDNNEYRYTAGYADGSAYGRLNGVGCYAGKGQTTTYSTDWEFTEVGFDKQYFKDKVNFYNTNFSKLYSSADKEIALAAIETATNLEQVYTALDVFCRAAEGKVIRFSTGAVGNRRYIQQTAATVISFTETANDNCRFQLVYAGSGAYYVKSQANGWYWGYLNRRGDQLGGTADTQWAGKWIPSMANAANSTGDITTMFCQNSNVIYYYLHAAGASLLTDWNDTDASKWTMDVIEETPWTVNITGGTATDRVIFDDAEYADGSQITADAITPTDVKTNINNRFVWGPIIDAENHTVTFEVRSTQENSITAGKFYQLQMREKEGQLYDNAIKSGNMVDGVNNCTSPSVRYKGSQIYFMNARSAGYPLELTGIVPESEIYYSYVYVPTVSGNNVHIQSQNGSYVHNNGSASNTPINISFAYDGTNKTFKWPGKVGPWSWTNTANWVTIGMSSSFTDANYNIELFFHPVTTGEDYDIYKVMNNEAAVTCNSSALVTTITNAGGTFFFMQKNAVLSASDFVINGEEPSTMVTNENNGVIELTLTERAREVHEIATLAGITDMYGYYKLTADISAPAQIAEFHGHLDGDYHKVTGLTHAIFNKLDGAKISNLILEDVNITSGDIVGAIANTATGNSRVYNCGILATSAKSVEHDQPFTSTSKISGTTAGSIVGKIEGNARVVNCYSYADVNGTNAGGIVGDWAGTWYNGTTGMMVANCMYYGNLTGSKRSPIVYGGSDINSNYSIYSYFRWKSMETTTFTRQNGALAATEDIWLDRFKFFQAGVTNHRDIAAYYVFGDASRISDMAQWYIDEAIAPWPILREAAPQKSVLNRVVNETPNAEPNTGALITAVKSDITKRYDKMPGTNGKLTVNINITGIGVASGAIASKQITLPITDMDDKHYDYTWGKVVLPFANEFEGWTPDYDYICTGWEISNVECSGSPAAFSDYNYADRDCTAKDIYHATTNPIIFAQGGNYIVPYGVTAITINAHFAKAYYLSDPNYDCAAGGANAHGGSRPTTYHGKTVYTTAAAAWGAMEAKTLPHDQALVLVGNYHYTSDVSGNHITNGCTVISVDEDCDQQPDYGWYSYDVGYRKPWMPIRWDFVPIIGAGMLQIETKMPPGLSIPKARGWFEMSETTLCRTFEFEISDYNMASPDNTNGSNAYIIKGGWFQQLVRCYDPYNASNTILHNKLSYLNIGGNAYINEFFNGNHSGTSNTYNLRPVNVTGGELVSCFMTDMGNKDVIRDETNVHFYCSGGKIEKYLSVYQGYPVVDATMKVDHARIGRFFGGGTTPKAQLSGNIDITMNYSDVDFFCGGPEFGDMSDGKSVTVNTTGSTFGEYYGAGFGGTALTRMRTNEGAWASINKYPDHRLDNDNANGGIGVSYEMEKLLSGNGNSLTRFYIYHAALSMAQTGNVTTNATNCLFKHNFFGGGCQGRVKGSITSVLDNCYVTGSAYGGGYKAEATTISVYPATTPTYPAWDGKYKAYSQEVYPEPEEYKWAQGSAGTHDETAKLLYTDVDMTHMGEVTGNTSLTIKGADSVVTGDVFGGGAESKVLGDTNVVIGEQQQ